MDTINESKYVWVCKGAKGLAFTAKSPQEAMAEWLRYSGRRARITLTKEECDQPIPGCRRWKPGLPYFTGAYETVLSAVNLFTNN